MNCKGTQIILKVIYILTPLPRDNEIPPFSSPPACGQRSVSGRILNGQTAKYGTWPWQVSVQRQGFHICGGSLVSESWVMSAAHCFAQLVANSEYQVQLGNNWIVSETSNQTLSSSVKQIILHPSYDNASFFADIALVELENPIAFTAVMSPICLLDASVHVPAGKSCWVTGWGNINPQAWSSPLQPYFLPLNGATSVAPGYPGVYNRPNAHNRFGPHPTPAFPHLSYRKTMSLVTLPLPPCICTLHSILTIFLQTQLVRYLLETNN
uniref:Peptidase S1 domain-containing protein n=1 Tax=Pelusios castaneus TaxID=367368 RepID=A0A8C8SCZ9_9SAUR